MGNFDYQQRLLNLGQVLALLEQAARDRNPLSLARFGHGEINMAWCERPGWVEAWKYRAYAGATGSPLAMQSAIREALLAVDIAGLLSTNERDASYAEATAQLLSHLDFSPPKVCSAWIFQYFVLHEKAHDVSAFWRWLRSQRLVLVGRRARAAAPFFRRRGVTVTTTLTLEGWADIDPVLDRLCGRADWQIAVLAAGLPATVLAPRLAARSGRIALDVGHALDLLLDRHGFDHDSIADRWNRGEPPQTAVRVVASVGQSKLRPSPRVSVRPRW